MKRRIQELCGFKDLSRERRLSLAYEILKDVELKQSICHEILGCTHKDVEQTMRSILDERQLSEEQIEKLELETMAPEKFDPEITFKINKKASNISKDTHYSTYTKEQVMSLLAASNAPYIKEERVDCSSEYGTLSREECERLISEHFAHKINEKKKQEEHKVFNEKALEISSVNTK